MINWLRNLLQPRVLIIGELQNAPEKHVYYGHGLDAVTNQWPVKTSNPIDSKRVIRLYKQIQRNIKETENVLSLLKKDENDLQTFINSDPELMNELKKGESMSP